MPPVAHSALVASILISAIGAVVTCLLVVRYGFAGSEETTEPRRLVLVRLGHAMAVVCFAGSAMLTTAALARAPRSPATGADPRVRPPATSADPRLPALAQRLGELEARLDSALPRVDHVAAELEGARSELRRLDQDLGRLRTSTVVERPVERRAAASPRRTASASPAVAGPTRRPAPHGTGTAAAIAARPIDAPSGAAGRVPVLAAPSGPTAPRAADVAVIERKGAAATERRELPAADKVDKEKRDVAVPDRKGAAVVDKAARADRTKDEGDLTAHVKRDWETIKRGFKNAGADFRSAIDELGRNLRHSK